jgi:hypothetical protein
VSDTVIPRWAIAHLRTRVVAWTRNPEIASRDSGFASKSAVADLDNEIGQTRVNPSSVRARPGMTVKSLSLRHACAIQETAPGPVRWPPLWNGTRRSPSRTPEWLADLVSDRRPARSHILQFTLTQGRKISPEACARSPNLSDRGKIPNHDTQRVHRYSCLMMKSLPALGIAARHESRS